MASLDEILQLLRNVSPIGLRALRSGQLFRPACRLMPLDPDLLCDFDVKVPVSDGFELTASVFRSKAREARGEAMPVVMCAHPYDNRLVPYLKKTPLGGPPQQYRLIPQEGKPEFSVATSWEAPDPNFWLSKGYAVVNLNLPGYANSGGPPSVFSEHQGKAFYDAIEWVGAQPWCTGSIGLNGVSFLAISQYHVAACREYGQAPPSLKAISPWEGVADIARDLFAPGGVRETGFPIFWWFTELKPVLAGDVDDFVAVEGGTPLEWHDQHPVYDDWAEAKQPDLEAIDLPTLLCATFSDQGVHNPGAFKAFLRIGSRQKWLYTHRRLKWDAYYSQEVQELTCEFFDCFVKGESENGFASRPPVRLEVRASRDEIVEVREESAWPLPATRYDRFYLDPGSEKLVAAPPAFAGEASYDARRGRSIFRYVFDTDTEITGHMVLRLFVEVRAGESPGPPPDDLVLCAVLDKCDAAGRRVPFYGSVGNKTDGVSRGFARAAVREIDEARSTPWLPFCPLRREQRLVPGEVAEVVMEIYPSSTLFRAGESLELTIAGHEIRPSPPFRKDVSDNRGLHVIHASAERPSHLLVPVIPVQ
ncbi:MAG: CocE/NonD family hydrolase [Myxococcota bacterium]|nr:CocE/NonD family hydrolase [Myxococcota bacterium]